MAKNTYHVQCEMRKPDGSIMVSWIPETYAKKGSPVSLKEDGVWDKGWIVTQTFGRRRSEDCEAHERDYMRQREASDI